MNSEIKEALARLRQRDEDSLAARLAVEINRLTAEMHTAFESRRAESARHDAVLANKLAAIAADAERETAITDAYKRGFIDAWNLSR